MFVNKNNFSFSETLKVVNISYHLRVKIATNYK